MKSVRLTNRISNAIVYVILIVLSFLWLTPIFWIIMTSFRGEKGAFVPYLLPKSLTLDNYVQLFQDTSIFNFGQWYMNTLYVAIFTCLLSTFLTTATAYVMSRFDFVMRKPFMNMALVLGMFPGFMSMIAVYYVLKTVSLTQNLTALILVFSAGAGLKFYISKGFFDLVPKSLDEAARIDGASNARVFISIILPLSRPIIVYTAITSFMIPWMDFIYARVLMGDNYDKYTASLGLFTMLRKEFIDQYFTRFAAGSILIAIPITVLFIVLQRFYVEGITGGAVKG